MNSGRRPDDIAREAAPLPEEPLGTTATTVGAVKWWRDEKGYGAIATDATAPFDVWCHFSAVDVAGYKALTPGHRVEVEYERADQDSFKYRGLRVRVIAEDGA